VVCGYSKTVLVLLVRKVLLINITKDGYVVTYYKNQKEMKGKSDVTVKNFKPMECLICHRYYFLDDTDLEKENHEYEGKEDDYCLHCGWKYDLYQFKHPNVPNEFFELYI